MKLTFVIQAFDGDKLIIDRIEVASDEEHAAHDIGRAVNAKLAQWLRDQKDMQESQG